ncbi:MAG: strawberry notch family protein [Candidatus Poribacteria bacterium]|nr:strawberry notch family protein [Candidatus Poribacteria bacterium]
MATLREYLTPAEQERFKKLYNQGYFNQITFNQFTQRLGQEFQYIDMLQKQLDRTVGEVKRFSPEDVKRWNYDQVIAQNRDRIAKLRAGAFDSALSGNLGGRTRRALQDLDRAMQVDADGNLTVPSIPGIPPIFKPESEKTVMDVAWDKYWEDQGVVRGALNVGASSLTGPIRGGQQLLSGEGLGENPLEAVAEIGSILPVARAFGRWAPPGSLVSKAVRSPLWKAPSYTTQAADILGAGEEAHLEVLAEGGLEAIGAGGDLVRHLRSRKLFQGLDPQAAEDAQTTESTTEHDDLTGSRTAPGTPGLSPEAARAADRAAADSAVESADAQVALDTATQQRQESLDQQLRREAWERMLIEAEAREAAEAEQAAIEQSFIDQDDAYTQQQADAEQAAAEQQVSEAEKIEFTKAWLPFYADLAGGSQSEGIRLLNAEYDAGVRNPISHRYDQIAAGLQEQMGVVPSQLHQEADRRLRQQIGEKWYNIYRGIDQRPTPQQRAQRANEAADKIVEGTDGQPTVDGQGDTDVSKGTDTAVDGDVNGTAATAPDTPGTTETIPEARIGTENTGYESDGVTAHNVRPVLRELDDLVPSHQLDGEKREDYPEDLQPREGRGGAISMSQVRKTAQQPNFAFLLEFFKQFRDGAPVTSKKHPRRILSGNGRTLALQLMRNEYPENWQGYQDALRAELEKVGIDPAEADAMEAPVLTYEILDDIDEVALAKDANVQATLDHTAAEQASQDTEYFDDDLMALWQPGEGSFEEVLTSEENQQFRSTLFSRIPTHLVSAFMTADNKSFSNDGIQRIQNAMIRYVFGESIGDQLAKVLIEQGLEDVKNIEAMLRNAIASLAYAKANGQDISTQLASAIFRFIEINKNAERDAQQRKQPKDVMLYAGIEAVYQSGALIEAPTLLEKQLLYLIYAKRNAPRQLADDFQAWAQTAVSRGRETDQGGLFNDAAISEAIFAGIIREYIRETIFATRTTQDGQTVLVPPDSLPPELVRLRENMDAMSDAADKERLANDWIDAFLRAMNEGETQNETATEDATTDTAVARSGSGTPGSTEPDPSQGTADRDATGTPATPESGGGGVAPTQPQGTDSDESGRADGAADDIQPDDRGSDLGVENALGIVFPGENITASSWNKASRTSKRRSLARAERAGNDAVTEAIFNAAVRYLERNIDGITQETPDGSTETDTADATASRDALDRNDEPETPIDTNQVVGVSRRTETPTESSVSPIVQRDLDALGISVAEWERMKADGEAIDFINNLTPEQQEQVEWAVNLTADVAGEMPDAEMVDEDLDIDEDEDFFNDAGILRDITDQQRSDFDTVRRKLFLARTIERLEAKQDRTPIETAQLRALQAPQRTDAQQEIYERLLNAFVDQQVARLQAKQQRSVTENRILDALTAVQAEGLPEEASELSLYADLETPDQEHSRPLAETRTLAGVQAPATADTDLDLPETVKTDTTKLSPAQQSSVKAIIAAFLRKIHTGTDTTVQGGFLLGDKPGVGKTRQALATLWHYMRQGINRHFVLAPNEQLLNNYSTDMQAMGGRVDDISRYSSSNQQFDTPIGTATYSMLTRKPDLKNFTTTAGNQNAIADIVAHLTGARPTLQQTHPETYQASLEAFSRLGISDVAGANAVEVFNNIVAELRRQAGRVVLDNPANVEQFRQRVTPRLADLLLAERTQQEGQQELLPGTELQERVKQLLRFAQTHINADPDPDFDAKAAAFQGVIVLDEMHKTAGTSSQIGQMIATLHQLLPNAKFLYMSATPFKEIDNFWVAERLGLWGANQPFSNFRQFRSAFRRAARAVKEVIPLHLKQIGRYVSRALSSKETRYTPVEIPLTDTEKAQYDAAVAFVQGIRQEFESALDAGLRTTWGSLLEADGEHGKYRGKYMRMFYGEIQKVFLAVLDAMKAQGLETDLREKLQNGDKVIVQLENTWEATTERAEARGQDTAGPFDLLIDFVANENTFPVHEHITEVRTRRDGSEYTVVVPRMEYDADGNTVRVIDPTLKRLQTELLSLIQGQIQQIESLPFAADIIHQIAADAGMASGEISGRANTDREALATAFSETTDLNLIVLGPAGLTGINLPVKDVIKDKVNNLFHYLVQSSWNVNTFEQGLGRGKRSNSAIDPQYQVVYQDLPGGDRVLGATLAKFAEMGALAGQADNALMQNIDKVEGQTSLDDDPEADVFEETQAGERGHVFGVHGQEALAQLWKDMYDTGEFEIADTLGLDRPEIAGDTGFIDTDTIPTVQQFFQRLLHQSTTEQPRLYEQFESRLKRIVAYRRELGELDVGANDLNSKDGQVTDRLTIYTDPDTGQTAEVVRLAVKRKLPRRSWDFVQKVINGEQGYEHYGRTFAGIYTDADGHVWAVFEAPLRKGASETEYVRWGPRGTPVQGIHTGEHRLTEGELAYDFKHIADMREGQQLWEAEDTTADAYVDSEMFMATGLILPKWQDLSTQNTRHAVMGVIPMLDGSQLHGRVIPSGVLPEVLEQIGGVDPNHFDATQTPDAEAPPNGEGSDIDIPAIVRDIIGQQTDTKIAARLERIAEHIHKKLPLRLRGHLVKSAAEAALLGQLIRDPQVEHTWIVYRKNDRIVKIEPMSLNRKGETKAGDFAHIKRMAAKEKADSILRIHNHPSGVAKWSDPDKRAAMQWHKELGTLMAEDIIVDSGTYAYRTFENGEYTWHEDTVLDPGAVEFDTSAAAVSDPSGEVKPTDPLYQNPLIRGAREAATYMMGIKRRTSDVAELIFVDKKTGKIVDAWTDTTLRGGGTDPVQYIKDAFAVRQGQQVHIAMWGDDAAVSLARSLQAIDGVDSVWVNSQRVTGIDHIGQQGDPDTRTQEQKETDAILNRTLERLSGKEQPGTKRKGQDTLESPRPYKTIPKKTVVEANKLSASQEKQLQGELKTFVKHRVAEVSEGWDNKRLRQKIQKIIDKIHPYRLYQAYTIYSNIKAIEEVYYADRSREWREILQNAVERTKIKDRFFEVEDIAVREIASAFVHASNPLSGFQEEARAMNRNVAEMFGDLELLRTPEGLLVTRVIDGQKFYLTPLSENELTGVVEFDEMTPDEQTAVKAWLDKIKSDPRSTNDQMGGAGTLNPITDTISARLMHVPGTMKIEYVQSPTYPAEHNIRHRRSMAGDVSAAIYNSNKLLASRHVATTTKSNWDAVTDNADFVFLAPVDRRYSGDEGYAFDAEHLIRKKGAVVGTTDSIMFYDALVERIVYEELGRSKTSGDIDKLAEAANTGAETFEGAQRILQRIKNEIGDVAEGYRVAGEDAIKLLHEGKAAEILVPGEVSLDDLLYIRINNKPYGLVQATDAESTVDESNEQQLLSDYTAEVQRTNPDSVVYRVHAPEDLAMEGRGRAKTAEIGEKALNTFVDSNAGIMKILRAWSPTARRWARMTKNEFVSGFGKLTELEAPEGSDTPSPADVLKEILRERQHISKLNAGRALSTLEPHLLAFNKLARKRTSLRTEVVAPKTRTSTRKKLSEKVWNFIEYNTPIENDKELLDLAEGLKEAWREMLIHDTQKIVELMGELENINEKLYVTDAAGKQVEWYGESFDGFQWDAERRGYVKDGKFYTIEEAHRAANKLYMPHYFRGKSPLQEYSALQKMQDDLNKLLASDDPAAEKELLQRFEIEIDPGGFLYTHLPTGKTATTAYEMVRIVADHVANEDAALQGILNYYEGEGRVGYYGHLERTRETDDRFYARDISLMAENRMRLWDRLAEVATIGQQHPLIGDSPRMKTLIEQVMNFDKTPREAALRKVIEALNSGQEGMFERMPQFASGVETALDIMLHWLERDADGKKTGRYQEIDIARMNLDDATLSELERIGLIEQSNGNWKVVGENIDQRHATMARHIHEFYNTLAQRKNAVHSVVLGLGNWHTRDPLEMESSEFWKKINDTITVLTLNHGVAIQNLLEIPLISMLTGANPLFKGLRNMSNKEYRGQMQQLARGLSHARKFMADTTLADKYLGSRWTFFSKSDEFSRASGLGIGLENAKAKIQRYAEAEGKKRDAIGREMDTVRLNQEVIANIPAGQLTQTLAAAEELILNNEVDTVFSSEQGGELTHAERLAGTMLRSMFYISDEAFKQYDATSLPQFMLSKNPLIRVFMKYKSWMLQQNRLVYNQLRRAYREAKQGNLEPLGNFVAATGMMGLGTGGLLWLYSALQGDDDDKTMLDRMFKGLAAAQSLGIASVMFELAMYAEGNWYQMSNLLAKQAAGPTFSVAAQMIGPVLTGDFERAGTEALRRLPIVSFSRRVGGWRLLEEATGTGEKE